MEITKGYWLSNVRLVWDSAMNHLLKAPERVYVTKACDRKGSPMEKMRGSRFLRVLGNQR